MSLGKLLACLMVYFFIESDLKSGHWRTMILSSAIIPLIVIYGCYSTVIESPRFLLYHNRSQEALTNINRILYINVFFINKGKEKLTIQESHELVLNTPIFIPKQE